MLEKRREREKKKKTLRQKGVEAVVKETGARWSRREVGVRREGGSKARRGGQRVGANVDVRRVKVKLRPESWK